MKLIQKIVLAAAFFVVLGLFAGISYVITHHERPPRHKKLARDDGEITRALFSSQDDVQGTLIGLIDNEKKQIRFAIYTMTDKELAKAFIRAFKRGVRIEGVVDRSYGQTSFSTVHILANAEIPLWVFQPKKKGQYQGIMHNKFCIFESTLDGRSLVWTGSYNFTARASLRNEENVVILDSPKAVKAFRDYFDYLKKESLQISGAQEASQKTATNKKTSPVERAFELTA
jgi:phosphatidylserine/phosphatidylglycerophosphate/cardiolipin synthase-like enzyme